MRQRRASKSADSRPLIRDAAVRPQTFDTAFVRVGMVLLAIVVGFVIGFAVRFLMDGSTWLTDRVWKDLGTSLDVAWFPLVTCAVGGLVIGLWTWFSHDRVQPLEHVMGEFKRTGSYRTNGAVRPIVSFLLPLVFGGSIGFEAGLTGIITSACCWIRDKLKEAGLRVASLAEVTIAASMAAIFGTPLAGIVAGAENQPDDKAESVQDWETDEVGRGVAGRRAADNANKSPDANLVEVAGRRANRGFVSRVSETSSLNVDEYTMRRGVKIVLYMAAACGAAGGVAAFSALFGASGGLPRFEPIAATYAELLWAVPCIILAYAMTLVYHGSSFAFDGISRRLGGDMLGTVAAPVIAGIVMGAIAMAFPYVLFPGEAQSEEIMGVWGTWTVVALLATGILKALVTPMCLKMGWMGGSFFPSIFAGVACGYGLAALTGADPMLMVTVTTTAYLAGVTRKPLLSLAILALCFPLTGLLWSGLAAAIGGSLPVPAAWLEE